MGRFPFASCNRNSDLSTNPLPPALIRKTATVKSSADGVGTSVVVVPGTGVVGAMVVVVAAVTSGVDGEEDGACPFAVVESC